MSEDKIRSKRMREAIFDELTREGDRSIEEIFYDRGDRHVRIGAIADLAIALIIYAGGD